MKTYVSPFLGFILLFLCTVSCEEKEKSGSLEVSVKTAVVANTSGQIFVTVTASGEWQLGLSYLGEAEGWASLSTSSGSGSKYDVRLIYEANEVEEARALEIVLTSGKKKAACSVTQKAGQASGGVDPEVPQSSPGWLELPAVSDGLDYYSHSFTLNGKEYRNYSIAYDKTNCVSHWVAYPLCSFYSTKKVDRTEDWNYDPKVSRSDQPVLFRGFKSDSGTGYDRGHQIPSADRLCCVEANSQTFYFTNMTPQIGSGFNQNIWANFETKVRGYSNKADTLYVVTGCVVDGSSAKARDNNGKAITVPVGYFKALLFYNRSNTLGVGGYSAAAFYLEHKNYPSSQKVDKSMCMSIDELEEMTGIDFFVNLPAKIGEASASRVEAEDPSGVSIWW